MEEVPSDLIEVGGHAVQAVENLTRERGLSQNTTLFRTIELFGLEDGIEFVAHVVFFALGFASSLLAVRQTSFLLFFLRPNIPAQGSVIEQNLLRSVVHLQTLHHSSHLVQPKAVYGELVLCAVFFLQFFDKILECFPIILVHLLARFVVQLGLGSKHGEIIAREPVCPLLPLRVYLIAPCASFISVCALHFIAHFFTAFFTTHRMPTGVRRWIGKQLGSARLRPHDLVVIGRYSHSR